MCKPYPSCRRTHCTVDAALGGNLSEMVDVFLGQFLYNEHEKRHLLWLKITPKMVTDARECLLLRIYVTLEPYWKMAVHLWQIHIQ